MLQLLKPKYFASNKPAIGPKVIENTKKNIDTVMELNRIGIKRPAWPCKHANKIDVKKRALQSPMRRAIDIIKATEK
ncbi:MAG: hypothetical protein CM1200mP3_03280 [Chloroflexota bacterium]|nr:MAG: hypothetical protein CM1200mP3_03280 [Chloroflexota bacterium]